MKRISEVIAQLQAIQSEYGDLRMLIESFDDCGSRLSDVCGTPRVLEVEARCGKNAQIIEDDFVEAGEFQQRLKAGLFEKDVTVDQKPEPFMAVILE